MRVKVTGVNFTTEEKWIFKFCDTSEVEYFAMNSKYYSDAQLPSPITKMKLDQMLIGMSVKIEFEPIGELNLVTSISV